MKGNLTDMVPGGQQGKFSRPTTIPQLQTSPEEINT